MGEKPGTRAAIDRMTKHLVDNDPSLRNDPRRARKIASDAARRVNHGESIHTEGKKPRR